MLTFLSVIAIIGYGSSAAVLLQHVLRNRLNRPSYSAVPASIAILAHALLLYFELAAEQFHQSNIATSLAAVAWLLALLSLLRGQLSGNLLLKPVVFCFAAISCVLLLISPTDWGTYLVMNSGLLVHIVLSLVAYGILLLATLYTIQANYVSNVLKRRQGGPVFNKLPPLMTVERYFFRLLATGTVLLIASLASGFMFLDNMFAQSVAHKTILSLAAAGLYIAANVVHWLWGWRGRSMLLITVTATLLLTLGYFGSRFVKDILIG